MSEPITCACAHFSVEEVELVCIILYKSKPNPLPKIRRLAGFFFLKEISYVRT